MKRILSISIGLLAAGSAPAKIDLVTLPQRDQVQLTIYNLGDLTLVRENRALTLREGLNKLQFSWENTLIDPTSLAMKPMAHAGDIDVQELVFPPRAKNLGLWTVRSEVAGRVPMSIDYFTSGISWRAFYMGTLTPDETSMRLQGYVRVTNNSGEDYENAVTRLIVGKVHILDEIAALSKRSRAYGEPGAVVTMENQAVRGEPTKFWWGFAKDGLEADFIGGGGRVKVVKKEGLSEYFLYTIDGTESIPQGWSKRLPSFNAEDVPVKNLYKYEEERYGRAANRFLSFKNDRDHQLGETPIPGGMLKVYRAVDDNRDLSYEGQSTFKYIPVDEDVELNLGPVANVTVAPTLMDVKTENYRFKSSGAVEAWDETQRFECEVKNTRKVAVRVEIRRNMSSDRWKLDKAGDFGEYEEVDARSVKFTLELPPRSMQTFTYTVTTRHGANDEPL